MRRPLHHTAALVAAFFLSVGIAHAQVAVPPGAPAGPTLDEIIAKNINSKGGLEKIKATTTVRMTGKLTALDPTGREVTGPMVVLAKRPNMMRRETTRGTERIVNGFDGTSLWMVVGTMPVQEAPASQAAYARQDAEFDSVFVDYRAKGAAIVLAGKATVDGKDAWHLKVTKKGGPPQDYFLDAETGLEKKVSVTIDGGGNTATIVTELSDYRDVDGRMVPFMTRQIVDGTVRATIAMEKVEFNVPIDDALFRMPASR